ncbi:hypothetical protein HanRHA438_Chr11g0498891 [Helianthus annuus]|uniref:Uncharacterized protein n=1 Tax=Helianthus annuus TaxID=4232 RepID=A0A251TDQ7_HELAN|nr:hypothetical protein HanXRQr2_Chr11g0486181 [Helianthus annuus]KAJ0501229.1 hypothetical protein HanHA300_Chr11g0398421 [Helianthus annuus]KAJ0517128.1 hypothetical protein HanHA89_Chr11g0421751 [Helianthus annuus]KAJ0685137.1 hypothetical protein HanLR1_Chr11g0399171 [Helianthus annuus]KAJ0689054.1 hypothetical protein HanOQP8_Chr11g0401271 [Helianthus annuus]
MSCLFQSCLFQIPYIHSYHYKPKPKPTPITTFVHLLRSSPSQYISDHHLRSPSHHLRLPSPIGISFVLRHRDTGRETKKAEMEGGRKNDLKSSPLVAGVGDEARGVYNSPEVSETKPEASATCRR